MNKIKISSLTWVICGFVLLVGLGATWFFTYFDKEPFTRYHGYSEEARRNPFLAAQKFLAVQNVSFEKRENYQLFEQELGRYDTVIINSSRVGMSAATLEKMKQWVNDGGNLVLLATESFSYEFESSKDVFLDSLGLRYYDGDYNDYQYNYESEDNDQAIEFEFENAKANTRVHFNNSGYIEDTSGSASFIAGNQYSDQFIQYEYGEGLVSVATDFSIWNNRRIDKYDHAMFLRQLIGNSEKAWLLYNRIQPSVISMAMSHAPLVVISFVVFLCVMLWSGLWRVGAKRADDSAINREILQHLSAAAEFNYRLDQGAKLVESLMASIHHRMSQLSHGYSQQTPSNKLEKIAIHTGLPKTQLSLLLNYENETEEAFLEKVKLIQTIKANL